LKSGYNGMEILHGIDLEVKPGEIAALIGPNGAGKSTVFNLVSGILKPDSGRILLDSQEITSMKPEAISNMGVSRLFQQSRLFNNLTVEENLLLVLDNQDTKLLKNLTGKNPYTKEKLEKVKDMLKLVDMEFHASKLARDLSYGQKRLVELARAMLKPHSFMMLDEPVAGVNPVLRKGISRILLTLRKSGETILLIEHDMNFTLGIADRVVVMHQGRVIAEGTPKQIKKNPKVLEAYLGE
ncbi:MAG: ABC transporter ATP-binding protein, partial [Candidatus Aenigmarchaeota archaeon]|nr:ABC transporter ATP-binding protein [Candidatus Aenigmarchaeota archaeon]